MRAASTILLLAMLIGFDPAAPGQTSPPATRPAASPAAFAAIGYFNNHCTSCHGPYGSFYGESLKKRTDEELKTIIKEMADGPGQAPLEDTPLQVVTAFHRSLLDGKPFLSITSQEAGKLTGEVTPGASVTVIAGDQTVSAQVKEHVWTAALPEGMDPAKLRVTARLKDRETSLDLSKSPHSHTSATAR